MTLLEFGDYQIESARTRKGDMPAREAALNAALGLAGEAGEVCDLLKKAIFHEHHVGAAKLKSELGDVLWYLTWLAELHGMTLREVAEANIEKLRDRYPDGFSAEASRNRQA